MAYAVTDTQVAASTSLSLTIPASGNNRCVIVFNWQERNPAGATESSFNAVVMTQGAVFTEGTRRLRIDYMLDADLPAGAGTYTVSTNGGTNDYLAAISVTGIDQIAPSSTMAQYTTPAVATHSSSGLTADDFTVFASYCLGAKTTTPDGNTTIIANADATGQCIAAYADSLNNVSYDISTAGSAVDVGITFGEAAAGGATVTQADTTPEDGVQQSFTTTGLTGTITAATLGGYDILSLLSDTDPTTATTYTLDISAIEASQGAPRIGQTSTLSITATGGTATTDVVIQPKTGWAEVDLAGTLNKDAGGFLALLDSTLGLTSAVGDIIYYANPNGEVITAAGVYTSDLTTAGQNTPFVIQQGGSATTVSTSEGGAFYPYGEAGGSGIPKTKYRRFPWQPWNPL